ncbi:MAG: lipocalin-like domain-containing protein [Clostridiaceae bacterium]|nr:lipocalin-like domain-containing protein [Clostridiaceae bacterium]
MKMITYANSPGIPHGSMDEEFLSHPACSEWWYSTGYLQNDQGRMFTFQFTLAKIKIKGKIPLGVAGTFNSADVRDLGAGVIACCTKGRPGEGYIMGNRTVTMQDLFDAVAATSGCKRVTTILPAGLAVAMASIFETVARILRKPTIFTKFTIYNLMRNNNFNSGKAVQELGYQSRPFAETILDEVIWLREEGRI